MVLGMRRGPSTDQYEELMARHRALTDEVQRRQAEHMRKVREQLPLAGTARSGGASTDGIRLSGDGTLMVTIKFHDLHGVESSVVLRAAAGGPVEVLSLRDAPAAIAPSPGIPNDLEQRLNVLSGVARDHLSEDAAAEFLKMLRPALRLSPSGEDDPVVAQLGGLPTLPINSWPVWEEHGPLSHILSYDCSAVSGLLPELGIPSTGRLAFFYFDGQFDNFASTVISSDPATSGGFRVLHLHPETSTPADITDAATPTPPGLEPFRPIALTATRIWTWPDWETPVATKLWERHALTGPRPGVAHDEVAALYESLWNLPESGSDAHQIGGHPSPQQGPVEMEAEQLRRGLAGESFEWANHEVQACASRLKLLLQVASEDAAGMIWGDMGQLYFLASEPNVPTDALFTWQCG